MKLGKNEKRVLALLLKPTKIEPHNYPENGKSIGILADDVYPNKEVKEKGKGAMGIYNLLNSVVVSLTNTLNNLYKKGFVIKAKPIYNRKWIQRTHHSDGDVDVPHPTTIFNGFNTHKYGEDSKQFISIQQWKCLPTKTKLWWIITDEGREIAEKLISENPELDKLSGYHYKHRIEKEKRKLIKRCNRCDNFNHIEMYCKEEEMQGIEYETEVCKYHHNTIDEI